MRNRLSLLIVLMLLLTPLCVPDSDADGCREFRLDMVCPTGSEAFSLKNISAFDADLLGYSLTDGEGTLTFVESVVVGRGCTVTLAAGAPEEWMLIDEFILYDSPVIEREGRFSLSDNGDELSLMDPSGKITDCFVYGDTEGCEGWDGEPYHRVPKRTVAYRNIWHGMPFDWEKWIDHVPGRTLYHFTRTYSDCTVTPFLFPESKGDPIIRELQEASESVRICMYTFDSERIASALLGLLESGVDVDILIEGAPAGGMANGEIPLLKTLAANGADVRFIKSTDGYKRFDYVHAKYALIDGDTTVVTSENWTGYAFENNRGWGASVQSRDCAEYLTEIFDSDFSGKDILEFDRLYPTAVPKTVPEHVPVTGESHSYIADVTTAISPDYSREALMCFLDSAKRRIYSQQLNVDCDWMQGSANPLTIMEDKTAEGLDVRLQVDVTYDSPYDSDLRDGYGIYSYYTYKGTLDVRYTDGSRLFHNKGVIADDRTWLGSMNWTDASIRENREMCLIIDSPEVTDVYASAFLEDWGPVYDGVPSITVKPSGGGYGKETVLDASGSSVPFGTEMRWDLDGDGEPEKKGNRAEWRFYRDTECTLIALLPDGTQLTYEFTVAVDKETKGTSVVNGHVNGSEVNSGFIQGPVKYVPLLALIATIIVLKRIAMRR